MNERSTSITTSLLMSYGILDYRWQASNNSSISAPHSPPTLLVTVFHLYLESRLPVIYLSLVCLFIPSLFLLSRSCSHPCDVWYVSLVKTTPGQHVDIPPCLFISPHRAECCWVVLINDIDLCTLLDFQQTRERARDSKSEQKNKVAREREREIDGKKKQTSSQYSFRFSHSLFPWEPMEAIESDGKRLEKWLEVTL